ncbi:MAG: hypothetical protein EOO25_12710 [Comamonadaceae bacterium]|nr:MAG: hypothetical protein EOO25_12710 [Comamonadaceae bacterium]
MHNLNPHQDYNRMLDAARLRAHTLRREAIQHAWDCAGSAALQALRSANRLANAVVRHARLRREDAAASSRKDGAEAAA